MMPQSTPMSSTMPQGTSMPSQPNQPMVSIAAQQPMVAMPPQPYIQTYVPQTPQHSQPVDFSLQGYQGQSVISPIAIHPSSSTPINITPTSSAAVGSADTTHSLTPAQQRPPILNPKSLAPITEDSEEDLQNNPLVNQQKPTRSDSVERGSAFSQCPGNLQKVQSAEVHSAAQQAPSTQTASDTIELQKKTNVSAAEVSASAPTAQTATSSLSRSRPLVRIKRISGGRTKLLGLRRDFRRESTQSAI